MGQNQSTNGESKRGLQPKSFAGNYHNQIPLTIILDISNSIKPPPRIVAES